MRKKNPIPSSRRHIWVFDEDWEFLSTRFGPSSASQIGTGPVIRNIIHMYVTNLKARAQVRLDESVVTEESNR